MITAQLPLVSICIPVYNDEVYIKDAIKCVLNQTYANWELIICDDCSKDNTLQVAKSFTDPRITVIKNEKNLGLSGNWNEVVRHARGEYIKLLPSDDMITSDCIEKQMGIFLSGKYPTVSLVTCYRQLMDSDGKEIMVRKFLFNRHGLMKGRKVISLNILIGTNIIGEPAAGLFKKSVISQIGGFDESNNHVTDYDFWFRVLLTGDLYIVPEPMAQFRITKTANTFKMYKVHAKLTRVFAKKIYRDKRFKINFIEYSVNYINSYFIQLMKKVFINRYLKN